MKKSDKAYIEKRVSTGQVKTSDVATVVSVTSDGRHRVRVDGGREFFVYSATGENYQPGEAVSISYQSVDKRQAEITGRPTRRLAPKIERVWR